MSEKVYKWRWDCGYGVVEGVFVATPEQIDNAVGEHADFGEVLGHHSEVYGTLEAGEFTVLSEDPTIIAFVKANTFGYNPLGHIRIDCDDCGERMFVEKVQTYWCYDCEERLCYDCGGSDRHKDCRDLVTYDKRGEVPA